MTALFRAAIGPESPPVFVQSSEKKEWPFAVLFLENNGLFGFNHVK
jgi:hypothetical protein